MSSSCGTSTTRDACSVAVRPVPERPGTLATVCWARRQAYFSLMSNSSVHRPCAAACYLMCCMRHACVNSMGCETAVACLVPLLVPVPRRPTYCRLSPRWAEVREDAILCAWGQRSVSDRVRKQGRWANAPCWARTRALAGQLTSLRLSNVPPRVLPRNLGNHFSRHTHTHTCSKSSHSHTHTIFHRTHSFTHNFHTQLSNCSILHHLSHTIFHTQLCHTPSFTHNFSTHNSLHTTFLLIDHPPPPLSILPSPSHCNFVFRLLEEVDLWGYPVL